MLVQILKTNFGYDTPIFTEEILKLFPQYTRAYVFRLIKSAEERGALVQIDTGIYYLPQMMPLGISVITASDVVKKKYIQDKDATYGIYSGLVLQNAFSLTTQIANTPEIVTNRTSARCRKVTIDGKQFIIRKSRTEITNENVYAYRVLQVFTENNGVEVDEVGKQYVFEYIKKNAIKQSELLDLAKYFPARTLQKMITSLW